MFTKTYINQCQQSKEIQDSISKTSAPHYMIGETWIPFQHQLQQLLRKDVFKYYSQSDVNLLSKMRIVTSTLHCYSYLKQCSLEEMWLGFYMHEAHGKKYANDVGWY